MSDSTPKLRSPLAAYGPIIALIAVLVVALGVLFTLGGSPSSPLDPPPPPSKPPGGMTKEEMYKRAGVAPEEEIQKEISGLIKTRGMSWFDLKPEERQHLDRITRGSGRMKYEAAVDTLRAKKAP
jgi:hypothetical protein